MIGIKFDEEKIKNCIEAYHNLHGEYPYLICAEKTMEIIPEEEKDMYALRSLTSADLCIKSTIEFLTIEIGGKKYINVDSIEKCNDYGTWYGAKILIDNKLEFGEVLIR